MRLIRIVFVKRQLKESLKTADSTLNELYDLKNSKVNFEGLQEMDKIVKEQVDDAIHEYEGFCKAVNQKLNWKHKDWKKINLEKFENELHKAVDFLENDVNKKVNDALEVVIEKAKKLECI